MWQVYQGLHRSFQAGIADFIQQQCECDWYDQTENDFQKGNCKGIQYNLYGIVHSKHEVEIVPANPGRS
ncbi:hypothetical protein D3C81_1920450 [compost metagenome]